MKKFTRYLIDNIYEGSLTGVIVMIIIIFLMMLGTTYFIMTTSNYNGRVCNYSGKFWVDDTKDPKREGDLKGCFSWEDMIRMERL